jgi:hypothetical protein
MRTLKLLFVFILFSLAAGAQKKEIEKIKEEGNALYIMELANTVSLDVFYENEFDAKSLKGFMSYKDKDSIRTIFYTEVDTTAPKFKQQPDSIKKLYKTKMDITVIIKSFAYKKGINKKGCIIAEVSRKPNDYEKVLLDAKYKVQEEFAKDTSKYKRFEGTTMSVLILDYAKFLKVYMITLPNGPGHITFGNDYYFEYDKKTQTIAKREKIHNTLIPIPCKYYGKKNDPVKSTFHNHKGNSPYITATDVCILLLFKGTMEWEQHYVHSEKWTSSYTMYNGSLTIIDSKTFKEQTKPKEKDPYENPDEKKEGE